MSESAHSHGDFGDDSQSCPICQADHLHYGSPLENGTIQCVICNRVFHVNNTVKLVRKKILPMCQVQDPTETSCNQSQITMATTTAGTSSGFSRLSRPLQPIDLDHLRSKLFAVSIDKQIRIRDLQTNDCVRQLVGHTRHVTCFDLFGAKNHLLLSSSSDLTVKVWNLHEGVCVKTFGVKFHGVVSIKVLSEDTFACTSFNRIQIHNLFDGSYIKSLHGHQKPVTQIQVLPNEALVSGSKDNCIKIWSIKLGECMHTLRGHIGEIKCLLLLEDGQKVVSGSSDATIKLWDIHSGDCLKTFSGHVDQVNWLDVIWEQDAPCSLVSCSHDQTFKLWDMQSGECKKTIFSKGKKKILRLKYCSNGILLGVFDDESIEVWDIHFEGCIRTIRGYTFVNRKTLFI